MTPLTAASADVAASSTDKCLIETAVVASGRQGRSKWVRMVLLFPVYSTPTQRPLLPVFLTTRNDMDKQQSPSDGVRS